MSKSKIDLGNSEVFARHWLLTTGHQVTISGSLMKDGECLDYESIKLFYLSDRSRILRAAKIKKTDTKDSYIEELFRQIHEKQKALVRGIKDSVKFDPTATSDIKSLMYHWFGREATDMEVSVVKHFIWQVKRKMFFKKIYYHQMLIFAGPQGKGKTESIGRLLGPIGDLALDGDILTVSDPRTKSNLQKYNVIFFDELAKIEKADVGTLKALITATEISYRPMGTNKLYSAQQNCTFIGAVNGSIAEKVFDSTGMRRYFELYYRSDASPESWEFINNFDYLSLWRSVDENQDTPYIAEFKTEIQAAQAELINKDDFELFIEDYELDQKTDNQDMVEIKLQNFYNIYHHWAINNNCKTANVAWFSRKMNTLGFKTERKKINGILNRYVKIPKINIDQDVLSNGRLWV